MRIPSQMNDNNLFREAKSRRGERKPQHHAVRKVLRLCVALALVVVVMHKAGETKVYELFFPDSRTTPTALAPQSDPDSKFGISAPPDNAVVPLGMAGENQKNDSADHDDYAEFDATDDRRAEASVLAATLKTPEQSHWLSAFVRASSRVANSMPPLTQEELDELPASSLYSAAESLPDKSRDEWTSSIDRFSKSLPLANADNGRLSLLRDALRDAAITRVADGGTWRSMDYDAFFTLIAEAEAVDGRGARLLGVMPLLQQPDVYRGSVIRVEGTVARSERKPAQDNPYDVSEYWQLWLLPDDGSRRLIEVIVPDVPESVAAVGPDASLAEGPKVSAVGRFLKRRSYAAASGAELAPVVIGRLVSAPGPSVANAATRPSPLDEDHQFMLRAVGIVSTIVIGVAIAVLAMWRSKKMETHVRGLRRSNRAQPDAFLSTLEISDTPAVHKFPSTGDDDAHP